MLLCSLCYVWIYSCVMCGFLVCVMCAFLGCVMCVFLSLCYVRIFRLCYVRFLGAGSPLRGLPLASLAWLASRAKLAPVASLAKEALKLPCQQYTRAVDALPAAENSLTHIKCDFIGRLAPRMHLWNFAYMG